MSAPATANPSPIRLQFSLRLLLLALTAFAIGFPIWYRWPYEESTEKRSAAGNVIWQTTTTWQRQWGGDRLKNGIERTTRFVGTDPVNTTTTYVSGKREGAYATSFARIQFSETGQYADDEKEGRWVALHGKDRTVTTWHRDLLDGACEFPAGREYRNGVGKNVVTFAA